MRLGSFYRTETLGRLGFTPPPRSSVLDVGCHDGVVAYRSGGGLRVGVDIQPQRRYPIHYVRGDGTRLPFRSNSFDWVFALEVIEHVRRREELIASALRVLRPGGTLLISVPHLGMRVFPAFLTGWLHVRWGHDAGFRGIGEDEIRRMIPPGRVSDVRFLHWRGLAFLRGYFFLRLAWRVVPTIGRRWAHRVAERDARGSHRNDKGYTLYAIIRKS
ncbi:MAG: methyltransferase domain-containing protein [Planctomycetota bacterium]|nr:methyltransferase domain-containing protein [Planctomycetota bacterium]